MTTFGLHSTVVANNNGVGEYFTRLNNAGVPFAFKMSDAMPTEAQQIAQNSNVPHNVMFRRSKGTHGSSVYDVPRYELPPAEAAAQHWQLHLAEFPTELDPTITWVELVNETAQHFDYEPGEAPPFPVDWGRTIIDAPNGKKRLLNGEWTGRFLVELALLTMEAGYKLSAPGWSGGEPEPEVWRNPGMVGFLRLCSENPDKLAVAVHEYSLNHNDIKDRYPHLIGRYREILRTCDEHNIRPYPRIHITECGWTLNNISSPIPQQPMADIAWLFAEYSKEGVVDAVHLWALNNGDQWDNIGNKVNQLIDPLTQFMIDNWEEPMPEPSSFPGAARIDFNRTAVLWHASQAVDFLTETRKVTYAAGHRQSHLFSADDAGIGNYVDLNNQLRALSARRVIAVNPELWGNAPHGDGFGLKGFFDTYYPGIVYVPVTAVTPQEAADKVNAILNGQAPDPPPIPEPGLDNPVAMTAPADGPDVWPPYWIDVNPIGNFYEYGDGFTAYHNGADLNLNNPHWDADRLAPVYAIGNGTVSFAGVLGGTWGNVVVIRHEEHGIYSRYAHLDRMQVATGDIVQRGQKIGRIGNAFGQLAYHLHFDISPTNILATNPGHWPGNNLQQVALHYLEPRSFIRLTRPGMGWPAPQAGWVTNNANCRSGPATSFRAYTVVVGGTAVTLLNKLGEWWLLKLSDGAYGWIHQSLIQTGSPPPPPTPGSARMGLHASADPGDIGHGPGGTAEFEEFKILRPGVIKVLSAHAGPSIGRLHDDQVSVGNTAVHYIIRVFLSWGGRSISPQQFFNDTINDTMRATDALRARNVSWDRIHIELHNEPNLTQEGLGHSWSNGISFATWANTALDLHRNVLPNPRYMYPGLSPGGGNSDRYDSSAFLTESQNFLTRCDSVGVHLYWTPNTGIEREIWWLDRHLQYNRPIWVTESSYKQNGNANGQTIANQYKQFVQVLKQRSLVQGVTFFVASASNQEFLEESWIRQGSSWGIAAAIRA
jgi:hypothetical protein